MAIFQGSEDQNKAKSMLNGVTGKSVLRYTMMPEILPRIRALGMHFGHFAYLLALVFASARLIPQTHLSLNAANIGRFGVRQVIAIAANNITWSRKNIDQIGIFTAIVLGLIMIVIQAGLIAVAALVGDNPANAQGFFTPGGAYDAADDPVMIAFAQVFGELDDFWGAGVAASAPGSSTGIHEGIHAILSFYSMAMMVIAVIIVLYYIMTIVGEAAKTGTPFGQRFNSLWAPIRLVVALGLLVPLGTGLNSAQYLTLTIAKMGSGLATNAWGIMIDNIDSSQASRYIVGEYQTDWVAEAAFKIFLLEACMAAENKYNPDNPPIRRRIVEEDATQRIFTVGYEVGEGYGDGWHRNCGRMQINVSEEPSESIIGAAENVPVQQSYELAVDIVRQMMGPLNSSAASGNPIGVAALVFANSRVSIGGYEPMTAADPLTAVFDYATTVESGVTGGAEAIATAQGVAFESHMDAIIAQRDNSWIYAGVWYLEISRFISGVADVQGSVRPNIHNVEVGQQRARHSDEANEEGYSGFDKLRISSETHNALVLINDFYETNREVYLDPENIPAECVAVGEEDTVFRKLACAIAALIIPDELTKLASDDPDDRNLDPMSTLVAAGYSIFEKAWKYIGLGLVGSVFSSVPILGGILGGIGSMLVLVGALGLTAGFVLFFLLPVLPFIYFFFAVITWIMEIFEAIIAMPLWALSFLQISGDGFPGPTAMNGFYLLLSILLRPLLIVIGLIAGALIFGAAIYLLQTLFQSVILIKASGSSSGMERLIYTLIFAYSAYSAGVTSFKLVDKIPDQILRWIGSGTPTFSEGKEDPVGGNQQLMAAAGGFIGSSVANNLSQGASGMGQAAGKGLHGFTKAGRRDALLKKDGENKGLDSADPRWTGKDDLKHDPK